MSKGRFFIPQATLDAQATASDPARSAWVSANAGSGKTHVLSRRVIRLLLGGTDPSRILCLTYTRAAAANMSNRIFGELARWTTLETPALAEEVEALTGRPAGGREVAQARRLFAEALETPGGLKIQTIHAFCEAVLHQFPLEANIAGHFEMLDTEMEAALVAEARSSLIAGADGGHDPALTAAFADVLARGGEHGLEGLLGEIVSRRDGLRRFIDAVGPDDPPYAKLYEAFDFQPDTWPDDLAASLWPLAGLDAGFVSTLAAAAHETDAKTVLNAILPGLQASFAESDPARRLESACAALLTGKGELYSERAFKKALVERLPDLPERYAAAASAAIAARDLLSTLDMVAATHAALTVADWLIARYEALKRGRGFLDFNDLITRTAALLSRADAGAWVHYRLDRGIDHILVDEAQDTSPDQWAVVKSLAAEFFAGLGARDNERRTIFAVGDEKQSIYSFQGADPVSFAESGREFRLRVEAAGAAFSDVTLRQSFRSTGDVLTAVDRVFAMPQAAGGVARADAPVKHDWVREGHPGYVELWPSIGPEAKEAPDDWTEPVDHASAPAVRLAERIADTIANWLRGGELLEGKGRPIRPGDIMVLVRKRDSFVHALSRALKDPKRGVPVAGADRLLLSDHIAVKDLLALARVCLQPHDDLSLAALLRSPVFDVPEDELFELAARRGAHESLSAALHRMAQSGAQADAQSGAQAGARWNRIEALLEAWRNDAAYLPVFEFFAGVLAGTRGRPGMRPAMIARLGPEAGDILDEFLAFALAAERTGSTGLEAFVATMDSAAPQIKREMDQSRDQVRILTVHASKGLEAPVVFLVDPGSAAFSASHQPDLLRFSAPRGLWPGDGYVWTAGGGRGNPFARGLGERIRAAAEDEYRRLLYVGMTRAEDRLVVAGYHGVRGQQEGTWSKLMETALRQAPETVEIEVPGLAGPGLRFRVTPPGAVEAEKPAGGSVWQAPPAPAGLAAPLPPLPTIPPPLMPSSAGALVEDGGRAAAPSSALADAQAGPGRVRGRIVHRLLERLPGLEPQDRAAACRRYLETAGRDLPQAERERLQGAVMAILEDARHASLFAPGSRGELSIAGTVKVGGVERPVAGRIDRVAVSDGEVVIVDFKTDAAPLTDPARLPPVQITQLALYRALVSKLYPDRPVRAALLYTAVPELVEVPAAALDAALAGLGRA